MNNSGGISLYVHLMINFYVGVIKKYPQVALSVAIASAVTYFIVLSGTNSIMNSMKESNFVSLGSRDHVCASASQSSSDKKIILRLDDVQAYAYTDITKKIINDVVGHEMKMVLGIIPKNFMSDRHILREVRRNDCNVELALHGWDHSSSQIAEGFEFEHMSEEESIFKIREGKAILGQVGEQPIETFIPPGNEISEGTKKALDQEGIKYISGESELSVYGMDATTFDFPGKKSVEVDEILKKCDARFNQDLFCVIVVHPQDYLTDEQIDEGKYAKFTSLLEELKKREVQSVTFNEL